MFTSLQYCSRCGMPSTEPEAKYDELGVCVTCRSSEQKMHIDWKQRELELRKICDKFRGKGLKVVCALFIIGLLQGPPEAGVAQAQTRFEFIDVHSHLVGGRSSQSDYYGAMSEAINIMDSFGIRKTFILPPPQISSQDWYDFPAIIDALKHHPQRFAFLGGGGALNTSIHRYSEPETVTDSIKRIFTVKAEEIIKAGAIGFGEIASLHISAASGHPYEFVPADHPLILLLADVAAKFNVPIDLHMDATTEEVPVPRRFKGGDNPRILPRTVGSLQRLLAHNRQAKIVWAHGGSDPLGAMTPTLIGSLMDEYPNLYVSLRVVGGKAPMHNKLLARGSIEPQWLKLLIRHANRFVIGTDSFFVSPNLMGSGPGSKFAERNVQKIKATRHFLSLLPPEVFHKIARDNASLIYKIADSRN